MIGENLPKTTNWITLQYNVEKKYNFRKYVMYLKNCAVIYI